MTQHNRWSHHHHYCNLC